MKITLPEQPGRCRWCGCTDDRGCDPACSWANRAHTLCNATGCLVVDRLIKSRQGRAQLIEIVTADEEIKLL